MINLIPHRVIASIFMAGQKKGKLRHILNLGNWAGKKKIKLPALVPTNEEVMLTF